MDDCSHFSSRMALDVMLPSPEENFKALHVSAEDLQATPQSWACHGLSHLEVTFMSFRLIVLSLMLISFVLLHMTTFVLY